MKYKCNKCKVEMKENYLMCEDCEQIYIHKTTCINEENELK